MENIKTKKNTVLIALLAYLLTFVTGAVCVIPFVINPQVTAYFHSTSERVGFIFSFFMVGYLIAIIINSFLVKLLKPKTEIFITAVIYVLCSAYMYLIQDVNSLYASVIILGLGIGIVYTIPNYLIVSTFTGKERSSNLNIVDFCYSLGSFAYPMITMWILSKGGSWQMVFLSVIVVFILITVIALLTHFPSLNQKQDEVSNAQKVEFKFSSWNPSVYMVAILIFFYLLSYMGFTYWVEDYVIDTFKINADKAAFGLTLFWVSYAVGCFISSFAVKKIAVQKYILISQAVAIIAYLLILKSYNAAMFYTFISLLGLGCSTIFSSSISYGSLLLKNPSPRLISFFIASATVGSIVAESCTSFIQAKLGITAVIVFSSVFMCISMLIHISVMLKNRNPL